MKTSTLFVAGTGLAVCAGAVISLEVAPLTIALVVVALGAAAALGSFAGAPRDRRAVAVPAGAGAPLPSEASADRQSGDPMRRALAITTLLTMLVLAVDTQRYLVVSAMRYALLVVPLFALFGAAAACDRSRLDTTVLPDRFLMVLAVCGVIGSVVGKVLLGTPNPGIVIFLPMVLGLAHLLVRAPMTGSEAARYQRALVNVVLVFLVLAILSELPGWPLGNPIDSAHERSFFVAIGVAAALFQRRVGVAALIVVLAGIVFLQYPAATWPLIAVAALATGYATSTRGRRSGGIVLVCFAVGLLGFGITQVQGGQSSIAKRYFSAVSKTDNTNTRGQLWKAAELEIEKRPVFGSLFTGNFTVPNVDRVITNIPANALVEPHNDYLQIMVLGGLFGAFLFVGFIVSTNTIVIRRIHWFTDERRTAEASFARVLLIGFNAALAAAFFNPVISQIGIAATIYLLYALMMTVRPLDRTQVVG